MTQDAANLIVWDWNGTVLADTSACLRATNKVLDLLRMPPATITDFRRHYSMPIEDMYVKMGVPRETLVERGSQLHPVWHQHYSAATLRLRRGAKAVLGNLQKEGHRSVILSNYIVQRIHEQASGFGIREQFDDIIAFNIGEREKTRLTKGEKLRDYLSGLKVRRGIIIGDSVEEIEIGRELGFASVAITEGMCSTDRLKAAKPDYIVSNLGDIEKVAADVFTDEAEAA